MASEQSNREDVGNVFRFRLWRVGAMDLIDTQILRVYDTRYGLAGTGIPSR
jgi:hypothetical protein